MRRGYLLFLISILVIPVFNFSFEQVLKPITKSREPLSANQLTLADIWIRDPNICFFNGTYYMTGTTTPNDGFLCYSSKDLENWNAEGYIYQRNASSLWAQMDFWAAEFVQKGNNFYLFFSARTNTTERGTGVAISASHTPLGPFYDLNPYQLTPLEDDCLDGHLYQAPNGSEYLIYVTNGYKQ
jgi:beta-xylosidase